MEQYKRNWKNYYEILQVSPNAESVVITAAYRQLAQVYHPDTANNANASTRMVALNEAYEVLSNLVRRADYDREFKGHQSSQERVTYNHVSRRQQDSSAKAPPQTREQTYTASQKKTAYRSASRTQSTSRTGNTYEGRNRRDYSRQTTSENKTPKSEAQKEKQKNRIGIILLTMLISVIGVGVLTYRVFEDIRYGQANPPFIIVGATATILLIIYVYKTWAKRSK